MVYPDYDLLTRLELTYAQMRPDFHYKNLWWHFNGEKIGFGDLNNEDMGRIAKKLHEDEEFVGWNEHQGIKEQKTETPMVRIRQDFIALREDIIRTEGR